jgi:hypothetical protein
VSELGESEAFDNKVLAALVDGFRARAGAKERHQALTEYEVARRVGIVEHSYVEYESSGQRAAVRSSLSRLQRQGMARAVAISGRYETFAPSESALVATPTLVESQGIGVTDSRGGEPRDSSLTVAVDSSALEAVGWPRESPPADSAQSSDGRPLPTTFEGRLDEMIRLLRSIDHHLERITRA